MRDVRPGQFYRHFKNRLYQIITVAVHSETGEKLVIYQALYGDYSTYARPYDMFVSEVDHEKYPDVTQQYRFERVMPGQKPERTSEDGPGWMAERTSGNGSGRMTEKAPDPQLLRFLEAESFEERMECLKKLSQTAAQSDLDSLYVVLDMKPQTGTIREQTERIAQHLSVQNRYDGRRLR